MPFHFLEVTAVNVVYVLADPLRVLVTGVLFLNNIVSCSEPSTQFSQSREPLYSSDAYVTNRLT